MTKGRLILLWILAAWLSLSWVLPAYHPSVGIPPPESGMERCIADEWWKEAWTRIDTTKLSEGKGLSDSATQEIMQIVSKRCSATEEQIHEALARARERFVALYKPSYWRFEPKTSLLLTVPVVLLAIPLWLTLKAKS